MDLEVEGVMSAYKKKIAQTPAHGSGDYPKKNLNEDFKKYSSAIKNSAYEPNMIFKTSASPLDKNMPANLLLTQNSQASHIKYPNSRLEIDPK